MFNISSPDYTLHEGREHVCFFVPVFLAWGHKYEQISVLKELIVSW